MAAQGKVTGRGGCSKNKSCNYNCFLCKVGRPLVEPLLFEALRVGSEVRE